MPDPADKLTLEQLLPEALPADPLPIVTSWYEEAISKNLQPNPTAMTLATIDPGGTPSARIVLCKKIEPDPGCFLFATNKQSAKGRALSANPTAALVFFWDHLDRQVRIEGKITDATDKESDEIFFARAVLSRIASTASDQSEPIASRDDFMLKVANTITQLGIQFDDPDAFIPRPKHWGAYRLWANSIECWISGPSRAHDRAKWTRTLSPISDNTFTTSPWSATRLQP